MLNYAARKFRKEAGLREIKKGFRNCLRCGRRFRSEDVLTNRMCEQCSKHCKDLAVNWIE